MKLTQFFGKNYDERYIGAQKTPETVRGIFFLPKFHLLP